MCPSWYRHCVGKAQQLSSSALEKKTMCKIKLILIKTFLKQVLSSFGCSLMTYVQLSSVFLWFDNERVAPEKQNRKATSSPVNGKGVGKRVFTPIYTPCIYTLMLLWKRYTCIKGSMYFIPDYHPSVWGIKVHLQQQNIQNCHCWQSKIKQVWRGVITPHSNSLVTSAISGAARFYLLIYRSVIFGRHCFS